MADEPPSLASPEPSTSRATAVPRPPSLRQRQPARAYTTTWEPAASSTSAGAPPPVTRRRSSMLSDFSSMRSSSDNLLNPASRDSARMADDEPTHWHSAPLVFAILPAVGGLLFHNGSAVITDVLLLSLATLLLNWCVRLPWDWYHSARVPSTCAPEAGVSLSGTIPEEEFEDDGALEDSSTADAKPAPEGPNEDPAPQEATPPERSPEYIAALKELRQGELLALAACFLGPIFGAYLLHAIRASLSRPSEGLVSNYNLTIFLLVAEIRPASHLLRMVRARTLHLQRIVREDEPDIIKSDQSTVQDLSRRLGELETHIADIAATNASVNDKAGSGTPPTEVINVVRQSFQPQLDALNRAVRRYEKRATTQTMVTEARLQDLESRLKDALALAAAAAQSGQQRKPGVAVLLDWISALFMIPIGVVWTLFVYPFQVAADASNGVKKFLFGSGKKSTKDRKGKGKATPGQERSHGSLNGYRTQAGSSGSGRR